MAQRGCDACPDIDATPRQQIALANGGSAYYHLDCVPQTAHDTSDLHPLVVQYVHAREQVTGKDRDGFDLGSVGEVRSGGQIVPLEEIEMNGQLVTERSDELFAAEKKAK